VKQARGSGGYPPGTLDLLLLELYLSRRTGMRRKGFEGYPPRPSIYSGMPWFGGFLTSPWLGLSKVIARFSSSARSESRSGPDVVIDGA
jgi:hypothetical protein